MNATEAFRIDTPPNLNVPIKVPFTPRPIRDEAMEVKLRQTMLARLEPTDTPREEDFLEWMEHHRLDVLYPSQFVIYRDTWVERGELQILLHRDVYFLCTDWMAAQKFLLSLPPEERDKYGLHYVE